MTKVISIAGVEVEVSAPYEAGHVLTEAEAKSLNQTRAENIGNNFRKAIKAAQEGVEGAEPLTAVLTKLAEYDKSYEFTIGSSGGSRATLPPLEKEARRIAKNWIAGKLKEAGKTFKTYVEENGKEYAEGKIIEVAAADAVQAQAKKNLAAASKTAEGLDLSL